ncbi:hypothetical protein PBRA_007081 [Plasmodiophora brassicae]|uniref:Tyrosinase copper-binding domain-containing protein n=1 Tax=Plasmodiophora brassicae TaxID=37360 RepID=A0A0G4IUQ3_PLABS|nr:secrectory protein [Plasmodiophora brassicae]CEO98967.1 hypothetical protein PBRA_007081 [Plasmodiophora brassicae]
MHLPAAAPLWIGVVLTAIVAIADGELGPRKNLADLSPDELTRFRDAVRTLQQNGQWVAVAGDHGVPHSFCPHGSKKFLPWHRRFIARLEIALGVPLPYWDWTTGPIPQALLDATYVDAQGNVQANPLLAGPKAGDGMTKRDMNADFPFKSLADQEALTITRESFEEMSAALEGAHNDVHGSVGGDMNTLDYSAFDPIFWLNHNNVDRIWWQWQLVNKFAMYPEEARGPLQVAIPPAAPCSMPADDDVRRTHWARSRATTRSRT